MSGRKRPAENVCEPLTSKRHRQLHNQRRHRSQNSHVPVRIQGGVTPSSTATSNSTPSTTSDTPDVQSLAAELKVHLLESHQESESGIKCPLCSKIVFPHAIECHLVSCLVKPRLYYNDDQLTKGKGECVICLEDMKKGDNIARLPCLCIYHKSCIDRWFDVNRCCPEHP